MKEPTPNNVEETSINSKPEEITPEEQKYYDEMYEEWLKNNPPEEEIEKIKSEPEILIFKEMIKTFESEHSIKELNLIVDLTVKDAPNHPVREPARKALAPIFKQFKMIKEETDISDEDCETLRQEYRRILRAVGMIINDKFYHIW
ncbi:MAG: hypothetical protein ABIA91_00035 [Patescibacteria group bacterium]